MYHNFACMRHKYVAFIESSEIHRQGCVSIY